MTASEWGIPYEGTDLPVTEEWVAEHAGDYIAFEVALPLHEIIDASGIDGFMDVVDDILGVTLEDCSWRLLRVDALDDDVVVRYVGMVPEDL
jgi:hypothetical protein